MKKKKLSLNKLFQNNKFLIILALVNLNNNMGLHEYGYNK